MVSVSVILMVLKREISQILSSHSNLDRIRRSRLLNTKETMNAPQMMTILARSKTVLLKNPSGTRFKTFSSKVQYMVLRKKKLVIINQISKIKDLVILVSQETVKTD